MQSIRQACVLTERGIFEIGDRGKQHRRRAKDRCVDRAEILARIAAELRNLGCLSVTRFLDHAALAAESLRPSRMVATFARISARMSTTSASAGSSSVANWLGSNDAGIYLCERTASRSAIVAKSPLRNTKRTLPARAIRSR